MQYQGFESLNLDGHQGSDEFKVVPASHSIHVDGGSPIGIGDRLMVGSLPLQHVSGPQSDEGAFQFFLPSDLSRVLISYDHIEHTSTSEVDFGDSFGHASTLLQNGPRHLIRPFFNLGGFVDAEADANFAGKADGDDVTQQVGGGDDEDGVVISPLSIGDVATAFVEASAAGMLDGWIDFNMDGTFADTEHQNYNPNSRSSILLKADANEIEFQVPFHNPTGETVARFRFSGPNELNIPPASGDASIGEVEDYVIEVKALPKPGPGGLKPGVSEPGEDPTDNTPGFVIPLNLEGANVGDQDVDPPPGGKGFDLEVTVINAITGEQTTLNASRIGQSNV